MLPASHDAYNRQVKEKNKIEKTLTNERTREIMDYLSWRREHKYELCLLGIATLPKNLEKKNMAIFTNSVSALSKS